MATQTKQRPLRFAFDYGKVSAALVVLFLLTQAVLGSAETGRADGQGPPTKKVKLSAERFHFVPSRIKVPEGTLLEIEIESKDIEHGFAIEGTDIDVRIPEAGQGSVTLVFDASSTGRYRFSCSQQCGAGHASMGGVIVVKGDNKRAKRAKGENDD